MTYAGWPFRRRVEGSELALVSTSVHEAVFVWLN